MTNEDLGDENAKPRPPWAAVIFASRESLQVVEQCIEATRKAALGRAAIDVLVNGNTGLAAGVRNRYVDQTTGRNACHIRVWSIEIGDKANAWNQYVQHIWGGEEIAFFIDGYVRLNPDAMALLGEATMAKSQSLGGTGVPNRHVYASFARETGFHGNFCCVKGVAIAELKRRAIRLPFGLYRVDSLMGAWLSFGLNPQREVWDPNRIFAHPAATWQKDTPRWWHYSDVLAFSRRRLRQSRGTLENLAVKDLLARRKAPLELIPPTASQLVLGWIERCPQEANRVLRWNPLLQRALRQIEQIPRTIPNGTTPRLLGSCR
jgi:hypothetical protein